LTTKPPVATESSWAFELAEILKKLGPKAEDDKTIHAATRCALDYFAVVLAGLSEPVSYDIAKSVESLGGNKSATILFGGGKTSPPLAALANGTLAHALDFDDTLWTYIGHSSSVILSAALTMAEWLDGDGLRLISAFALGVEAAHRIGSNVVSDLTRRGWHPTPTIGVFGAAVAATMAMGGDAQHIASALTVAANLASGLRQNFGSKVKPLASGWAAFSGVMASILAQQGISGSENALEGQQGFFSAFAAKVPEHPTNDRRTELALVSPGPGFKIYPCCTGTHPTIDAMLMIQKDRSISPDEVSSIRIEVTPEVLNEVIYPMPLDGNQARFSLPYCAATALARGRVKLEHFRDESLKDPKVTALVQRIDIQANYHLRRRGGEHCPAARVTVRLSGGIVIQKTVHASRGNPGNPLSTEELEEKLCQCASAAGLPLNRAERFLRQIKRISETSSIRKWIRKDVAPLFRELKSRRGVIQKR
jgi:2-methylcitrate dehydratase PrpD